MIQLRVSRTRSFVLTAIVAVLLMLAGAFLHFQLKSAYAYGGSGQSSNLNSAGSRSGTVATDTTNATVVPDLSDDEATKYESQSGVNGRDEDCCAQPRKATGFLPWLIGGISLVVILAIVGYISYRRIRAKS